MSARQKRQGVRPSHARAPDTIDPESLPPPMRRAWERYHEPDAARHSPQGDGAHIYARVSSEEQARPGRTSIDEQIRFGEKGLAGTGIPIVDKWQDEGFTGASRLGDRPVGRELLAVVKPGQIVVAYRIDRFSRDTRLGLADVEELRQRGVGLFFVADHRWIPPVGNELDPMDLLSLHQGIVLAQFERDMLVSRTKAGRRALLDRGYWPWSVTPYGWKREHDGIGYRLVEDDYEQKALALMRRCYQRGASAPQITAALNEAGFRNRRGVRFEYSAVYVLLRKYVMPEAGTKSGAGTRSNRAKLNGNPAIGTASSCGVSAVVQQKIRDAERVQPIIRHQIVNQACTSYRKLADALNYLEVETPRGGHWYPSSVRNAMAAAGVSFASLLGATAARNQKAAVEGLPVRPNRSERHAVRRLYRLHGNPRGRVQKATPDILFMRDCGATIDDIARLLCLSPASIRTVVRRYPRWEIHDPAVTERVLARHAAGEGAREIARALGLEIRQVLRVIGVARWQAKPTRRRAEPLAEDRRAAILALRRQGKTGLEIYAELGVETEQGRQQIRRFLRRQARGKPELALRNSPVLTEEVDAARSEAKVSEDYSRREDYYPLEYWAKKWNLPPTPEIAQVAMLLDEGQPLTEIVLRTGLNRGRVKRIRAALRDGRMRARELDTAPPSPA
jgi:site-specific DNA recombinase